MLRLDFIIGLVAGILCTVSFLPQVIRAFKTKQTKDLSFSTFSIFSLGVALWIVYGILTKQIPIILTNITILVLALLILIMKAKYG
ncbi:MAG: SemiSWEET transporter [Candidatus Omnitrophica bacterium]|nr:SemiSWEET transporter [Candidatus Omnitrophota bacterium]